VILVVMDNRTRVYGDLVAARSFPGVRRRPAVSKVKPTLPVEETLPTIEQGGDAGGRRRPAVVAERRLKVK
jgi:hypothetical protein